MSGLPLIAAELLQFTTFLPTTVDHQAADGTTKTHLVRYESVSGRTPTTPISAAPRFCVIPTLEDISDANIYLQNDNQYSVEAKMVQPKTLDAIIKAIIEDAEFILMPEASIYSKDIKQISNHIRSSRKDFIIKYGFEPKLKLVLIGTTGDGTNKVVILDSMGNIVLSQDKLFGWDLEPHHTEMYGIAREHGISPRVLRESIQNGEELYIIDIRDFGRLAILICADANAQMPGDWCLDYAKPDWVYIPILDRSNKPILSKSDIDERWISRRSARAAYSARCRVISTNSLFMTQRLNLENSITLTYPQIDSVNVLLAFDGRQEIPVLIQEFVEVHRRGVSVSFKWSDGWAAVPVT